MVCKEVVLFIFIGSKTKNVKPHSVLSRCQKQNNQITLTSLYLVAAGIKKVQQSQSWILFPFTTLGFDNTTKIALLV
jgi:hypothetical protein